MRDAVRARHLCTVLSPARNCQANRATKATLLQTLSASSTHRPHSSHRQFDHCQQQNHCCREHSSWPIEGDSEQITEIFVVDLLLWLLYLLWLLSHVVVAVEMVVVVVKFDVIVVVVAVVVFVIDDVAVVVEEQKTVENYYCCCYCCCCYFQLLNHERTIVDFANDDDDVVVVVVVEVAFVVVVIVVVVDDDLQTANEIVERPDKSDAIERLTRSELDSPTSISRFRADVLDKRLDDIVLALADCTQRYGLKHVVFPEETYYQVKSAPLVHTDPAGRQYWLNETTGVWTKLGADYDGVDPNKAWRHTLDEADAAAVNGGDDSYDDSNLFGACSTRPACSTCVSDRRCAWCAVGQTCVVLDEGTSCRGGIEITRVAGCAAIQGEGGVLALPYAASTPAPSPAVNVEYLNLFGDAPGSQK